MKDKGDHDTCSCVVNEPVAVNEVVDDVADVAVVCMHDLAINEVVDNAAVVDTMAISGVVDAVAVDEGEDDDGVEDATGVDERDDDEAVDDEVVDDAMGVDGAVDDGEVVDEAVDDARGVHEGVDDAMMVYEGVDDAMVVADAMVDDDEVVGEKLQLDVNTVVELHFHVLLLGIQSTENKRKCQENVPGHCKFPNGTNRPISNLIVLRDYHNFSIQLYTVKYLPKNTG